MRRLALAMAVLALVSVVGGCARPKQEETEKKNQPKAEYKNLKAEEYPIPDKLKETLPGLVNDKIRIWKDISPTVNLVAYFPEYSLEKAIKQASEAFLILQENPAFKHGIDFWIVQVQPEQGAEVLVWGVKPSEVEEFAASKDLKAFFANSEYVLINDQIIEKGDARLKYFGNLKEPEEKGCGKKKAAGHAK
jgi:hypothetical protein